jgi:hypothetical protein
MRAMAIFLAAALACPAGAAFAGSFDGKWIAEIPPQAVPCNGTSVMRVLVADETIMGEVHTPWGHNSFNGKIDADGNGTFTFGRDSGTVKFSGDHFDANWSNSRCGLRHALGDREPGDAQKEKMAAERKRRQEQFAALVATAQSGGKSVDYTALRSAYPFTEFWDPYGNQTTALLGQAQAAQKGGDCPTALDKLDQVIKLDFTIDGAHALRADCLVGEKAAIESAIADGLIHSLMNSGDGASEKTAYVIVTMREEMDVLANHHIQTKTRQTGVRGSDGRYYDRVEGLSLKDGAKTRILFFDVSAFTAGRLSRDAEITTVAATIH